MAHIVQLTPYFEAACPETAPGGGYVAGFRDHDGEDCGLRVRLSADDVEPMLLQRAKFLIGLDPDGRLNIQASGLSDEVYDQALRLGDLPVTSLTDVVAASLTHDALKCFEDAARTVATLRQDLAQALNTVDGVLAQLRRSYDSSTKRGRRTNICKIAGYSGRTR